MTPGLHHQRMTLGAQVNGHEISGSKKSSPGRPRPSAATVSATSDQMAVDVGRTPPTEELEKGFSLHVVTQRQACHQPRRQRRAARAIRIASSLRSYMCLTSDRSELRLQKLPIDRARKLHQRAGVRSTIRSSRERNKSCSPVSCRSRGRIAHPPSIISRARNHSLRFE